MRTKFIRGGAALGAVAFALAAVAGCGGDDKKDDANGGSKAGGGAAKVAPAAAIEAAAKKTTEAKSAKFEMTMKVPSAAGAGGSMKSSGVMSWDPLEMDMTLSGSAMGGGSGGLKSARMVMVDDVMYMNGGAEAAKQLDGKHWIKIDPKAVAEQSGDKSMADAITGGLDEQGKNQDPAKQMAMFLDSPDIKKVGSGEVAGVQATHYKGTVSLEQAAKQNGSLEYLSKAERKQLVDAMKKQGVEKYNVDVWVDGDQYPVQFKQSYNTTQGPTSVQMRFSDWGAKVNAQAPAATDTVDLMEMLKKAQQQGG
ncbi:hypothetical protein G5C51_07960 [Streptomyces sp. A7024]|uniref:Lipoprotein n=1 Tax=Streptomyces coryli TaxID=1128680 RepID=A0A6G4TVK4_9ACTN|nr:hypothetical protein [Streptomyces coryli]NGN63843.1 hypothetical protein [Streptomyces coryli]